jgi:SAM-dependent methyltransferase
MTLTGPVATEARLVSLLDHLGVAKAHFAARDPADWQGMARRFPERIASLSLICPAGIDPALVAQVTGRLLVVHADQGPAMPKLVEALAALDGAEAKVLHGYDSLMWSDLAAERGAEIGTAMLDFLAQADRREPTAAMARAADEGKIAEITYRIAGNGPPLVLLPLFLAPSQWEPLLPRLAAHFCTITLAGAQLGAVAVLEGRGRSNYLTMVRNVLDLAAIRPGETVLDVGCGSGVIIREIGRRTAGANPLIGFDLSPYLLREASALIARDGYSSFTTLKQGCGEALPLADASVDVAVSSTVFEEGDADRMLAEVVRVTRPGGRIAVIVRAIDMPVWINLPLSAGLRMKLLKPGMIGAGASPMGCADLSLYQRFQVAGLTDLHFFPQLATVLRVEPRLAGLQAQALQVLDEDEAMEWRRVLAQAEAEGTSFIATAHHCAVGTKP